MKTKLILLILLVTLSATFTTYAAIPHVINFQGKATDKNDVPLTGDHKLTFRIYDAETSGNLKWTEVHDSITINNGIFQVLLGSVTTLDLPFDENYWISVQIGTDSEMIPRTRLASVGYAYTAKEAEHATTADQATIADQAVTLLTNPMPSGSIMIWPTDTPPTDWLLCDGSAISRATYAELFVAIGTTYGVGDGSTTFNLPDLRGRFPLGKDNMGGTSADRVTATEADNLGQGSGEEEHVLTITETPSHDHSALGWVFSPAQTHHNEGYPFGANIIGSGTTGLTGGGQSHNNMPLYVTINYVIKT